MADEEDEVIITHDDVLEVIELNENEADGEDMEDESMDLAAAEADPAVSDDSILSFAKHIGDVFSVDVAAPYVASGGEDDRAYVWKLADGTSVFECTGHSDSVTYVRFNNRKTLLATADMAGLVLIWNVNDFSQTAQFQMSDLEWLQWHHSADILFCGSTDGSMWMYLVPNGDCKVFSGYGPSCGAGVLLPDGKRLCAGYGDGGVRIWDLKTSNFVSISGQSTHQDTITCIDCHHDNMLAASGSSDGVVNVFHTQSGKIMSTFFCGEKPPSKSTEKEDMSEETDEAPEWSVESVAFSKIAPLLFTGTVSGKAVVWDLNSQAVRQAFPQQEGVVKAIWIDHCILIAGLDGIFRLYDARDGHLARQWSGHKGAVLDFCLANDQQIFVSAADDHTCKIFRFGENR